MACTIDFRCLDEGLGGQKKKRKREDDTAAAQGESMDMEDYHHPATKRLAVVGEGGTTYDGVIAGKVSGRKWKQAKTSRTSSIKVSHKRSSADERRRLKEIKKAYKERMTELKDQIRQNKIAKRQQKEEREKRKKENELRSGTKYQKISNPKTLKKMSKKERKLLRVVSE